MPLPELSQPEWQCCPPEPNVIQGQTAAERAVSGSMVQLRLGSTLMSVVWPMSPQGVIGTMHGEIRGPS